MYERIPTGKLNPPSPIFTISDEAAHGVNHLTAYYRNIDELADILIEDMYRQDEAMRENLEDVYHAWGMEDLPYESFEEGAAVAYTLLGGQARIDGEELPKAGVETLASYLMIFECYEGLDYEEFLATSLRFSEDEHGEFVPCIQKSLEDFGLSQNPLDSQAFQLGALAVFDLLEIEKKINSNDQSETTDVLRRKLTNKELCLILKLVKPN